MKNPRIDVYGDKIWEKYDGERHRIGGPAYEGTDGTKSWFINGKLYRLEGPAVEYASGLKLWILQHKSIQNLDTTIVLFGVGHIRKNK